jgi:hypothetical protein
VQQTDTMLGENAIAFYTQPHKGTQAVLVLIGQLEGQPALIRELGFN